MVVYTCDICLKEFAKKDSFIKHTEKKKKPCKRKNNESAQTPHKSAQTPHKSAQTPQKIANSTNENNNIYSCLFCGLVLSRSDILKRHMDKFCKVRKLQNEEKENILEMLIEKDKEKEEQNKRIEELEKTIEKLNSKIDKQLNKVKTTNINKGVVNNIIIPQNKLVNFGSEDVSKIPQETIRDIVKLSGYPAIVGCFNALHNNQEYPQGMNGYVSDKSRDKGMIWKDGAWCQATTNKMFVACMNKIDSYIQHCKLKIEIGKYNTRDDPKGDKLLYDLEQRVIKYYDRYVGNDYSVSKKTNKDFEKLIKENIINELCNIKDHVISNYERILDNMKNNDKLENKEQQIKDNKEVMNNLISKIENVGKKKLKEIVDEELDLEREMRFRKMQEDDVIIVQKKNKLKILQN